MMGLNISDKIVRYGPGRGLLSLGTVEGQVWTLYLKTGSVPEFYSSASLATARDTSPLVSGTREGQVVRLSVGTSVNCTCSLKQSSQEGPQKRSYSCPIMSKT